MTPATMRWLDRRVGALLCRGLARLRRALPIAPRPAAHGRAVLCIGLAEMGSIVLAAPAIRRLDNAGAETYFLTFARHRDVPPLAGAVGADRVRVLRTESFLCLLLDVGRFVLWARRLQLSAVVDLEPCMFFSTLLAVASSAREQVGFAHDGRQWRARNALYTRPLAYVPQRHMAENFAALIALAGGCAGAGARRSPGAPIPPLPTARHAAADIGRRIAGAFPGSAPEGPLIFLNPNAGDAIPQRRWDAARFAELGTRLLQRRPDVRIALIGSTADRPACAEIATRLPAGRCANLAGEFGIDELPALFAHGHLLVSNDSGPAHLASLTTLPTIVLFGPETPALYRPLGNAVALYAGLPCSPCITPQTHRASVCTDNRCMQAISVDRVHAVAEDLLSAPRAHRPIAEPEMAA
ncbi:MAG: glycosyltransferase family 9 protein [Rhodocyclaceae bacterium]|nr:glycosyltransferase family 9 protein [Rhodocyclaceae bacterium]